MYHISTAARVLYLLCYSFQQTTVFYSTVVPGVSFPFFRALDYSNISARVRSSLTLSSANNCDVTRV